MKQLIVSVALSLLVLPAYAAPRYIITNLGTIPVPPQPSTNNLYDNPPGDTRILVDPEDLSTTAAAINDQGQVVGQSNGQAFLWQNGSMQGLNVLPSSGLGDYNISKADAISSNGKVVGGSGEFYPTVMSGLYDCHAFYWTAGKMQPFTPENVGGSYEAFGINSKDEVVGLNGYHAFYSHEWRLLRSGASIVDLGTLSKVPAGNRSQANGINEHGQVVGISTVNEPRFKGTNRIPAHAVLWQKTANRWRATDLGTLYGFVNSEACAIDNEGEIIGTASSYVFGDPEDERHRAFLWSKGHMHPLRGTKDSLAQAINDHRQAVGAAGGKAALWQSNAVYNLNTLIPAHSGWVLTEASGINNKGQIAGYGKYHGQSGAFLLTPQ